MIRRAACLGLVLFTLSVLIVQTAQADMVEMHDTSNAKWNTIVSGQKELLSCKPCHALWNNLNYKDLPSGNTVLANKTRIDSNCQGCHSSANVQKPTIPSMVSNSVHKTLTYKCTSCHTIFHSAMDPAFNVVINSKTYRSCDETPGSCHQIGVDPSSSSYSKTIKTGTGASMSWMRIYTYNFSKGYKPPSTAPVSRNFWNSTNASPFGGANPGLFVAYVDPFTKDPRNIISTQRYQVCFKCHFLTQNAANAAVVQDKDGTKYIPLPENIFSVVSDSHSMVPLGSHSSERGESPIVEKRSDNIPQDLLYIIPVLAGGLVVLTVLASRRQR
ncbi:MAG: hypothetical protein M1503_04770 [Thaumarchaeota archaeon]|nr:hypothetical protein [Nitrososphaerota archaeon]MCL5317564.1 hypothetical protein [Nitrososphaerota archaeon]